MYYSPSISQLVESALAEDDFTTDVTAQLLGNEGIASCKSQVRAKQSGIFCGEKIVSAFQSILGKDIDFKMNLHDGDVFNPQDIILTLSCSRRLTLSLERTLLNFLTHLSGIATLTRQYVEAVKPFPIKILATRKTLPGLREIELYAVTAGGGHVHRRSLSDGILIKDNHQDILEVGKLIERAKQQKAPLRRVEVEVQNLKHLNEVLKNPPDIIMLDNMSISEMKEAIRVINNSTEIEISGGVTLNTIRSFASLGAHYISVGALTHSVTSVDLTLDINLESR